MWNATELGPAPEGPWIRGQRWDLTFIFFSALLVAIPLLTYRLVTAATGVPPQSFQESQALGVAMLINLACAFFIGGPHMYATYTVTLAERRFRVSRPWLYRAAGLVPPTVIALAWYRVALLVALFFAWASAHAVHQIVYLVRQYHLRAPRSVELPAWSRAVDYCLAVTCFYPVALWRLFAEPGAVLRLPGGIVLEQGFRIGAVDVSQQLPDVLRGQVWIAEIVAAVFAALLITFAVRSVREIKNGTMIWPRTLLLLLTVAVSSGIFLFDNLDVALQGFNLWHSTQYVGLVYLMNNYRKARGAISSKFVARISGRDNAAYYYGFVVAVSVAAGGAIGFLHYVVGLPLLQAYYGVHLSGLWIHYLWDHAVFSEFDALTPVTAAPRLATAA
jgi:hypothetical protein